MYVGIDIGGTKTIAAALDDNGVITEKNQFPTAKNYSQFIEDLTSALADFSVKEFNAGAAGLPSTKIDRQAGIAAKFGNLPWQNVAIQRDLEKLCSCPFVIENDAKLAALSEYMMIKDQFRRVLYITISTGIGYGLIVDGHIDENIGDGGGRTMLLDFKGKLT